MEHTRSDLLAEIVRGPAEHFPVLISRRGLVVAEGHDALRAGNFETRFAAVEEPSKRGRFGLRVHLTLEIDALGMVFVLDGRRHANGLVLHGHHHGLAEAVAFDVRRRTDVLPGRGFADVLQLQSLFLDDNPFVRGNELFAVFVPEDAPDPGMRLNAALHGHVVAFADMTRVDVVGDLDVDDRNVINVERDRSVARFEHLVVGQTSQNFALIFNLGYELYLAGGQIVLKAVSGLLGRYDGFPQLPGYLWRRLSADHLAKDVVGDIRGDRVRQICQGHVQNGQLENNRHARAEIKVITSIKIIIPVRGEYVRAFFPTKGMFTQLKSRNRPITDRKSEKRHEN